MNTSDTNDSPPPVPPIRSYSVSREKRSVPLPRPPRDSKGSNSPQSGRRPPPIPPPPKRLVSEVKPAPPPVPTHRRSRSEGRTPFGEDVISFTGDPSGKQPLESKKSLPLESLASQESGDGRDREPCRTPSLITQPPAAQRVDKDRAGSPGGSNLSNGEVPGGVTEPR